MPCKRGGSIAVAASVALFAVSAIASDFVTPCPPSPGPEAWPFRAELARPVLRKAPEKFALDDGYGLTGCLETVADDLRDFLGGTRKLCLRRGKVEGAESYRVEVTPEAVTLTAEDDDGMRRAVYWFEDRVLAGDLHAAVRKPWLRHRISRCFFGPIKRPPFNRDELMDDIDYYPDAYLNRLAHEGVNGLWLTVEFRDLVGTSFTRAREGHERRLAKLRRTVEQCRRYGIKTWLFAIEPHAVLSNDVFYIEHPDLFPISHNPWAPGARLMCASAPQTADYLRESTANIFKAVPDLGGLLLITHGERHTTCFSLVDCCQDGVAGPCKTCGQREPWQLHESVVGAMASGMRSVCPQAELISWFYMPYVQSSRADWVYEAARHMPPGVTFLYNFESGSVREQLGRLRAGGDYWLSHVGPSDSFTRVAASARSAHVPFGAKILVGNSHEDATVPFVPVPGLLYRKYAAMRRAGCSAVMQCWYFGNYPGVMNEAAGALAFEDFLDGETAFLERLARPVWGKDAAAMAKVWQKLSEAYAEYPMSNDMQYYGPFHAGVAWPMLADVQMAPLGRTWKPEDPPSGDTIGECLENHTLSEALVLSERMARGAAAACDVKAWCGKYSQDRDRLLDLGVIRTLQLQFAAARDIFEFYLARAEALHRSRTCGDATGARIAVARMRAAVEREIALTRELLPYVEADARLGFHSEAEQYQFFPEKLRWRLGELQATMARIGEIDGVLASGGVYPESELEKTAARCVVNGESVSAPRVRFRLSSDADGDLVVRVEKKGMDGLVIETYDAAGTMFVRRVHVGPDGLHIPSAAFRNVITPGHEADVQVVRTSDGFDATVRLSALGWGDDPRQRPCWLRLVSESGKALWPALPPVIYRLNLDKTCGNRCGRVIWQDYVVK